MIKKYENLYKLTGVEHLYINIIIKTYQYHIYDYLHLDINLQLLVTVDHM